MVRQVKEKYILSRIYRWTRTDQLGLKAENYSMGRSDIIFKSPIRV